MRQCGLLNTHALINTFAKPELMSMIPQYAKPALWSCSFLNICILSQNSYTVWRRHSLHFNVLDKHVHLCACTHGLIDQLLWNLLDIWTSVHYCWCLGHCNRNKRDSQKMTTAASINLSTSLLYHFSTGRQMFGWVFVWKAAFSC